MLLEFVAPDVTAADLDNIRQALQSCRYALMACYQHQLLQQGISGGALQSEVMHEAQGPQQAGIIARQHYRSLHAQEQQLSKHGATTHAE